MKRSTPVGACLYNHSLYPCIRYIVLFVQSIYIQKGIAWTPLFKCDYNAVVECESLNTAASFTADLTQVVSC